MNRTVISTLTILGLSVVVLLSIARIRSTEKTIEVHVPNQVRQGLAWQATVRLAGFEGDDVEWKVTDGDGKPIEALVRQVADGTWSVDVYEGFEKPLAAFLSASVAGRPVANRGIGKLEPHSEQIRVGPHPFVSAALEGSELVVRAGDDWPSGTLPSIRLVRTNRARFSGGLLPASWRREGGWEWRRRIPYPSGVQAVEIELLENGQVRNQFPIGGLSLQMTGNLPVVHAATPSVVRSKQGLEIVVPTQSTASSRGDEAALRVLAEDRLTLEYEPTIVSPSASSLGLRVWRVQLQPEPEYSLPPDAGPRQSPNLSTTGDSGPWRTGPLPPLVLELMLAPAQTPPPPRLIALAPRRGPANVE